MIQDYTLPEPMPMPDYSFPIKGNHCSGRTIGSYVFRNHWHSHIELLYFISGEALIECNSKPFYAQKGDLIVVNSNELHQGNAFRPIFYTTALLQIHHCLVVSLMTFAILNI